MNKELYWIWLSVAAGPGTSLPQRLINRFGDDPETETISAQNGKVDAADEEGTGVYSVQLSINFTQIYKER